ncbi:MAG TPA: hypothetical protein VES65_05485 [Solirubrobacteraceae bacterium]|nr:hypothetical protein [Solirubrobacteraceae bacterium]
MTRSSERLVLHASAPAKINLGLFVGELRAEDRRHELASVVQAISLADELTMEHASEGTCEDEIVCPGVALAGGENLAASALRLFREATGWEERALRVSVVKRVPVAAGLGGGSADAAATLRLARHASGLGSDELLLELGARLGADVPAQIEPGRWLIAGAGERLRALPPPSHPFGVLVLPAAAELSTATVYERADRLGVQRTRADLRGILDDLRVAFELGAGAPAAKDLLHNDLQAAAVALCPEIERALEQALDAGADAAFVSGSGPTVVGLFLRANGPGRARRAADGLAGRDPAPLCAEPVDAAFARAGAAERSTTQA